jgi:hypothetical protein
MTTALTPRVVIRGVTSYFEQLFVDADGAPFSPLDPLVYPTVSLISPDEEVYQTGHATHMGEGRWRYVWSVPADAELANEGRLWRIDWIMVTVNGQQIQMSQNFDVVDRIEADPTERAYLQLCLAESTERLLVKFREPQETIQLFLKGADPTQIDMSNRIVHVQQEGFHIYYADTDALSYGCFIATWRTRASLISPWQNYIQQVRVPEDIFWIMQPGLRMLIDKVQKKDGHVQSYSDSDMYFYLQAGADYINQVVPISNWNLIMFPLSYGMGNYLLAAAAWWGLNAQYISEVELAMQYTGQTISLEVDRSAGYEAAMNRLQSYLLPGVSTLKENLLRRSSCGALATRSMDFGLSSLVVKMQQVQGGGMYNALPLL